MIGPDRARSRTPQIERHVRTNWAWGESLTHGDSAVLQDIALSLREAVDELRKLNMLLGCPNFTQIPHTLRAIRRKMPTPKPRRRRPKGGGV